MKFEKALPALKKGKMIREKSWKEDTYCYRDSYGFYKIKNGDKDYDYGSLNCILVTHLLDGDDWEIVKKPKKVKYTNDDLLELLLREIKTITIDNADVDTKVVSATLIYKNGGETDCKLPRDLLDCLIDRLHVFGKRRSKDA